MASCAWAGEGEDLEVRREALPWSRIFWIWAERFGLVVVGAGGIWLGRERRARWRALRAVRSGAREGVEVEEEERDLLVGSIWMGRRVKVLSIVGRG